MTKAGISSLSHGLKVQRISDSGLEVTHQQRDTIRLNPQSEQQIEMVGDVLPSDLVQEGAEPNTLDLGDVEPSSIQDK